MCPFAGWDMPLHYGSQLEEHHAVRQKAGLFDVSHMRVLDVVGPDSRHFLLHMLANHLDKLQTTGAAMYTCLLNRSGGVIDDLIVYLREDGYRLILNAGNSDRDITWFREHSTRYRVVLHPRQDLAILALQGPQAEFVLSSAVDANLGFSPGELQRFHSTESHGLFVSRTGYTGEDGFELLVPSDQAGQWWRQLCQLGALPCGLGARDTLRLEAGLHLHGQDLDETHTPLESGLGWTVAMRPAERNFIGRQALEEQAQRGPVSEFSGVLLLEKGVLRNGMSLRQGDTEIGQITSGGFSPTLNCSIALARVNPNLPSRECHLEIRGKLKEATLVPPVFVRNGKSRLEAIPHE